MAQPAEAAWAAQLGPGRCAPPSLYLATGFSSTRAVHAPAPTTKNLSACLRTVWGQVDNTGQADPELVC